MKIFFLAIVALSASTAFADCNLYIRNKEITKKQESVLVMKLEQRGFQVSDNEKNANFILDVSSYAESIFESVWKVNAEVYNTEGHMHGTTIKANDYALSLPLHMLTMSISTMIPTKGSVAMKRLMQKFPDCNELRKDLNL